MSETNELAAALAKAQGQFTNPERNRTVKVTMKSGGSYTFAYATLDAIMDMVRKPLSDNGLAISHTLVADGSMWMCVARLLHASGQVIECPVPILVSEDANAQGWGSGISYSRRYGVSALLGVASEEDDDGNAACANEATSRPRGSAAFGGKPATQQKAFRWSTATSAERCEYMLAQVKRAGQNPDPTQAKAALKGILVKLQPYEKDLEKADLDAIVTAVLKFEQDIDAECSGQ